MIETVETPATRAADLAAELAAFNEFRRNLLGNKPIDPEGEVALMPEGSDA